MNDPTHKDIFNCLKCWMSKENFLRIPFYTRMRSCEETDFKTKKEYNNYKRNYIKPIVEEIFPIFVSGKLDLINFDFIKRSGKSFESKANDPPYDAIIKTEDKETYIEVTYPLSNKEKHLKKEVYELLTDMLYIALHPKKDREKLIRDRGKLWDPLLLARSDKEIRESKRMHPSSVNDTNEKRQVEKGREEDREDHSKCIKKIVEKKCKNPRYQETNPILILCLNPTIKDKKLAKELFEYTEKVYKKQAQQPFPKIICLYCKGRDNPNQVSFGDYTTQIFDHKVIQ